MGKLEPIPKGTVITDNITKHIDKRFLSSIDLLGAGTVELTIDRVEKLAKLTYGTGESNEDVLLLYFKETGKPLQLCKTNVKAIAIALNTAKSGDWTGRKIKMEIKNVKSFGKMVLAIRVVG